MKVHGPSKPSQVVLREVGKAARSQTKARGGPSGERVEVSQQAQAMASVRDPEAPDLGRIEQLKAAIADGTFQIDAERIADAMMREEL